jgi:Zn-dependent protease with chaperone function
VVLFAATVALSPVLSVYRYRVRPPTDEEATVIAAAGDLDCTVVVVEDARDGPVNGYALGGPFRDVVGVSAFALDRLSRSEVAALLAHEAAHHHERHVLVRGGVSVAVLAAGAAVLTLRFDALVPPATLGLVTTVAVERIVALWVMRRLEYRAARHTSVETVRSLLTTLAAATDVDQRRHSWVSNLFSTHSPYDDRLAAGGRHRHRRRPTPKDAVTGRALSTAVAEPGRPTLDAGSLRRAVRSCRRP